MGSSTNVAVRYGYQFCPSIIHPDSAGPFGSLLMHFIGVQNRAVN